ncbi:unnamed protein product [Caenorhabditis brenneri]
MVEDSSRSKRQVSSPPIDEILRTIDDLLSGGVVSLMFRIASCPLLGAAMDDSNRDDCRRKYDRVARPLRMLMAPGDGSALFKLEMRNGWDV